MPCKNINSPVNHALSPLNFRWLETPVGQMIAISDEQELYLLEFVKTKKLARKMASLQALGYTIEEGETAPLVAIETELSAYFKGQLKAFKTPYRCFGSPFQKQVWQGLGQISYGETRSYAEQAQLIARPKAYRAVASANGANFFAILIPCHRVIASDGGIGGYGAGIPVKQWLLAHEKSHI